MALAGPAAAKKQLKPLRGSDEGSVEDGAERGLLMGVSNLTMNTKDWTGSQKK
jgi:hypothetical protein